MRAPLGVLLARFETRFPGLYAGPRWQGVTRDRVIPYRLFWLFLAETDYRGSLEATDRLRLALAAAHGQAIAWGGKDPKVKQQTRRLIKLAYPEV